MTAPPVAAVWVAATRPDLCPVCRGTRHVRLHHLDDGLTAGTRITRCPHCRPGGGLPLLHLVPRRTTP